MGAKKARTSPGDRYQRIVAVERIVSMLVADAFEDPHPRVIAVRYESDDHGEWDDIVDIFGDPNGREHECAWQIKRVALLEQETLASLVREISAFPPTTRALFAVHEPVRIRGLGTIEQLRDLCNEVRKPGAILSKMTITASWRQFWVFVATTLVADDPTVFAVLKRIDVRILGDETTILESARHKLLRIFASPVDDILNAIEVFVSTLGPTQRIDATTIDCILTRFASQRLPTPRTLRQLREQYLGAVIQEANARLVVHGLRINGNPVRLSDVWQSVRFTGGQGQTETVKPIEERLPASAPGTRLIVLGEAGAGKSEYLIHLAAILATRASTDLTAPVPLLIHARDLLRGLDEAVRTRWPHTSTQVAQLISYSHSNDSSRRFVVLVDGLDEAGDDAVIQIEDIQRRFGDSLIALVIMSRPVPPYRAVKAQELWIRRWVESEYEAFLDSWRPLRPGAVEAIEKYVRRDTLRELLANPLTATLCLSIAEQFPKALTNRAELYCTVVEELFARWASKRTDGKQYEVAKVFQPLQSLALEFVRQERRSITDDELQKSLRETIEFQAPLAADVLETHLGVLVRRGDGSYDFAFRGICEYMAARALLKQGDAAVVDAAYHAWGQEVARHAVGWACYQSEDRGFELMSLLIQNEEKDGITTTNAHLRPLLVAIRCAGDLPKLRKSIAIQLAGAAWRRLTDETSSWVGERVADAVQDWLRGTGPGWQWIRDEILNVFQDGRSSPAQWYEAQTYDKPEEWAFLLYHGDPDVRCVAVEKLTTWVDDPNVREELYKAFLDQGHAVGTRFVTLAAGIAFRKAARDQHFLELKLDIESKLHASWLHSRTAAALALRPDEANIAELVQGLKYSRGGTGIPLPFEVFKAIAAIDEGRQALEQHIPDWKKLVGNYPEPRLPKEDTSAENPPYTSIVRRRLGRAILPALRSVSKETLAKLQTVDRVMVFEAACRLAYEYPKIAVDVLETAADGRMPFSWDDTALMLGRAAVRHAEVRDALVHLWRKSKIHGHKRGFSELGSYPGRALEALIARNDVEAIEIYGEWIGLTHHSIPFGSFPEPLCNSIEVPDRLRPLALAELEGIWDYAINGRVDAKGERTQLDPSAVGGSFYRLSSFWKGHAKFESDIEGWFIDENPYHLAAALRAFQRNSISQRVREQLPSVLSTMLNNGVEEYVFSSIMQMIDLAGLSREVVEVLKYLVSIEEFSTLGIALILPLCDHEKQSVLSAHAAKKPMLWGQFLPYLSERLVAAAPGPWAKTLRKIFKNGALSSGGDWLPFVRALPLALRREVVKTWGTSARELPWVQDNERPGICVRPADRVRGMLYDLGLDDLNGS